MTPRPTWFTRRLACCMDAASLELYERNRLDPGVTFFSIDVIERNVKAMCEADPTTLSASCRSR